jgi:ABC-2 type transport system ATP-binding protein
MPMTQPIKNYSAGMKTKLMLASVFSRNTKLLILDEPTSGLDPVMRDELLMLIKDYIRNGERSVLYSTHITTDLEKTADYISFINNGKMILSENIDTLKESYYMVKDSPETLKDIKDLCIGYRKYDYGFEALIAQKDLGKMPSTCISQPASIDDIVVFHSLKGEKM